MLLVWVVCVYICNLQMADTTRSIPTHCLSPACDPSHELPALTGLGLWHQGRALKRERPGVASWLLVLFHLVPMETWPREWRRSPIGWTGGCGVCSSVVVTMKVWVSQRIEAAAERWREGLDKRKKEEHYEQEKTWQKLRLKRFKLL